MIKKGALFVFPVIVLVAAAFTLYQGMEFKWQRFDKVHPVSPKAGGQNVPTGTTPATSPEKTTAAAKIGVNETNSEGDAEGSEISGPNDNQPSEKKNVVKDGKSTDDLVIQSLLEEVSGVSKKPQNRMSSRGKSRQNTTEDGQDNPQGKGILNPEESKKLLIHAQKLMQEGDYEAAEELLQQSLEHDLSNRDAWLQMARLQRKLGLTEAELGTYQQWIEHRPNDKIPYYMLAETYARIGMDEEARYYISLYESMASDDVNGYSRAAMVYRRLNDREQEERVLNQWVNERPDSVDARRAWAEYQTRMGRYDLALSEYTQLAARMPNNPMPQKEMGDIYRRMGDYAQAQYHYETALSLRPGDIETLNYLADMRYRQGDVYGAIQAYSEIIQLEPGSYSAQLAQRRIAAIQRRYN